MSENERRLISENEALKAALEQLLVWVADLEARLNQNSGNSSKPPNSDVGRKRKPPVAPSGRKRGDQPGHEGKTRELAPPDEVQEVDPEVCERCGESLENAPRRDAIIRQFCESPAFKALIMELRQWSKACPRCGHVRGASLRGIERRATLPGWPSVRT